MAKRKMSKKEVRFYQLCSFLNYTANNPKVDSRVIVAELAKMTGLDPRKVVKGYDE